MRPSNEGAIWSSTIPGCARAACDPRLSYVSLDIETDGIDGEILSIALCNKDTEMICMQGEAAHWESDLPIRWFGDEATLLAGFLEAFRALDPDLLLGWNLINFDLDYLQRRCRLHRVPFAFGRGSDNAAILPPQRGGQTRFPSLPGRVALDGIDTLRAAFWRFESFELGFVAERAARTQEADRGARGQDRGDPPSLSRGPPCPGGLQPRGLPAGGGHLREGRSDRLRRAAGGLTGLATGSPGRLGGRLRQSVSAAPAPGRRGGARRGRIAGRPSPVPAAM